MGMLDFRFLFWGGCAGGRFGMEGRWYVAAAGHERVQSSGVNVWSTGSWAVARRVPVPLGVGSAAVLFRWRSRLVAGHRKTIRHVHEPGDFHEFTFSTYRRRPLLTNDDWRERLARRVDEAGEETRIRLVAFVFMPEHLHLLTFPLDAEPRLSLYLARIKQPLSKEIKDVLVSRGSRLLKSLTVRERPGKTCFRFWQEGPGYDRNLRTPDAIRGSIDYIHENPVTRKLCRRAVDWKWSSARYYLSEFPRQQYPGLPIVHGVPEGTFD